MSLTITPINPSVTEWGETTFNLESVVTGSDVTASFQWQFDGSDITDQTTSVLVLPYITASMSGDYSLILSGSIMTDGTSSVAGVSASAASHLQVNPLVVSIEQNPSVVVEGQAVTITLVASSSLTMSYAWTRLGNSLVPSATVADHSATGSAVDYPAGVFFAAFAGGHGVTITTNSGSAVASVNVDAIPLGVAMNTQVWNPYEGNFHR